MARSLSFVRLVCRRMTDMLPESPMSPSPKSASTSGSEADSASANYVWIVFSFEGREPR
jgi:hypothetical protein